MFASSGRFYIDNSYSNPVATGYGRLPAMHDPYAVTMRSAGNTHVYFTYQDSPPSPSKPERNPNGYRARQRNHRKARGDA